MEVVLQLQRETGWFEVVIASEETDFSLCVVRGKVSVPQPTEQVGMMSAQPQAKEGITLRHEDVYAELQDRDLLYDEHLKTLDDVKFSETGKY